ncbi:hypothetical protein ScPMuIL_014914 [Solemya velum]
MAYEGNKMLQRLTSKVAGEVKCVVVGDGGVGKTSMLLSYTTGGMIADYIPTCFDSYTVPLKVLDREYDMSVIDTAGQETYDRLRTLSYFNTDVFIVCFSVEDRDSFENVRSKWVPELRQYRPNVPFILVGTQLDIRGSTVDITNECITTSQGKKLARRVGAMGYLECSALEGIGLDIVFKKALLCALAPKKKRRFRISFRLPFKKRSTDLFRHDLPSPRRLDEVPSAASP